MDKTAAKLVAFARGPDNVERRAAAMLMLAELGIDSPEAVATATDAVASPTVLQEFALRYLEKLRPPDGVAALVPLLDTADTGMRERLRRLLVAYGSGAVPALAEAGRTAPKPWLAGAIEILAGIGTGPALRTMIELLTRGDSDLARVAVEALHRRIRGLGEKPRAHLLEHLLGAAQRPSAAKSLPARIAVVRTLADLGLPSARAWLLGQARGGEDPELRAEALRALAACVRHEKLLPKEVAALSTMLADSDFGRIVRPALDLLERYPFGKDAQAFLLGLTASPHVAVRSFALAKLGESDAPRAVSALLSSLNDADAVRRSAAGSLRKIPEARQALMKRFIAASDASSAFTMAETLAGYGLPWRRPTLEQIWRRYLKAVDGDDRIQGAYLQFLRAAAPDFAAEGLRKRVATLLRGGRPREAARACALLRELPSANAEDAYHMVLALLKARHRGLDAPIRRPDAALDLLVELEVAGFPASARLRRERSLTPEELYAVGFALAEDQGPGHRLAAELLGHLVRRFPRTKVGKAARNKLALIHEP